MRFRTFVILVSALSLLALAALGVGCKKGTLINKDLEVKIGRQASEQVEEEHKVSSKTNLQNMVRRLGKKLSAVSDRTDIEYHFKVLESDEVNAFALPGGWVYVYTGLIDFCDKNEGMVAGVVAHEIVHVAKKHGVAIMETELYTALGLDLLLKKQSDTTKDIAELVSYVQLKGYGRKKESEADRVGMEYMKKAGMDPAATIKFLEKLSATETHNPSELEVYFSTHPPTDDRINACKETLTRLESEEQGD